MIEQTSLWYVLLTIFAMEPTTVNGVGYNKGDVLPTSAFVAASITEEKCEIAADNLANRLHIASGGKQRAIPTCVELPAQWGDDFGFTPLADSKKD